MNRVCSWKPVVDKFLGKLSGWKAKLLSIGGRLALLKAVLGSLTTYFMSIFKVPSTVLKNLEALSAKFFWGADVGERKAHWVAWDTIIAKVNNFPCLELI